MSFPKPLSFRQQVLLRDVQLSIPWGNPTVLSHTLEHSPVLGQRDCCRANPELASSAVTRLEKNFENSCRVL